MGIAGVMGMMGVMGVMGVWGVLGVMGTTFADRKDMGGGAPTPRPCGKSGRIEESFRGAVEPCRGAIAKHR